MTSKRDLDTEDLISPAESARLARACVDMIARSQDGDPRPTVAGIQVAYGLLRAASYCLGSILAGTSEEILSTARQVIQDSTESAFRDGMSAEGPAREQEEPRDDG